MKSLTLAGICTLSIITLSNCASSPTAALKDLQTAQGSRVRPNTESAAKDAPIKTLSGEGKVDFDLTTEGPVVIFNGSNGMKLPYANVKFVAPKAGKWTFYLRGPSAMHKAGSGRTVPALLSLYKPDHSRVNISKSRKFVGAANGLESVSFHRFVEIDLPAPGTYSLFITPDPRVIGAKLAELPAGAIEGSPVGEVILEAYPGPTRPRVDAVYGHMVEI
jgi:hypothetical protein